MAAPMGTSFQKKTRSKLTQIAGTRASMHNNQLLVSTGVPSLDSVIGGGLAIGTVLLIEEDVYGSYGRILLQYIMAEGVVNKHSILLASASTQPTDLLKDLPEPILDDPGGGLSTEESPVSSSDGDGKMKIAWRYQNLPKVQMQGYAAKFGNYYDLTKSMNPEKIEAVPKKLFYLPEENIQQNNGAMNSSYEKLLGCIKFYIEQEQFETNASPLQRKILRIGIHSLGSPLWGEEMVGLHHTSTPHRSTYDSSLPQFLYGLRSLLRSAYATCVITMPTHLFQDEAFLKRVEILCDTVVNIDSFVGSDKEKNPVYKEYHGLFKIKKLPCLNSLVQPMPDSLDLAFKLRRKKFSIEKLHLPPELSETVSRSQEDPILPRGTAGCGMGQSKLDF